MRRVLAATIISVLWMTLFALSLFAQEEIPVWVEAPNFTIPPFEPPPGAVISVTTGLDNLSDNGDCTLREAIQAANSDTAVDTCPAGNGADLILLPAGVYTLSLAGRSEDDNATGDLDILSTLVISGAGSAETVIDANQTDRILHILTGTVEIRGVTVQNGRAADGADSGCGFNGEGGCPGEAGGGIANRALLRLIQVAVSKNRAGDGGDSDSGWDGGDGADGGGVSNEGFLEMFASQVVENTSGNGIAWAAGGGDGGGLSNLGTFLGEGLLISMNRSGGGGPVPKGPGINGVGGGLQNQGTLTITNSQILSNSTWAAGGGVYNDGTARLSSTVVAHNMSGSWFDGAGVLNHGSLIMDQCAVYKNVAGPGGNGGGLRNDGNVLLFNCTFSGNRTGNGFLYYIDWPGGSGAAISNFRGSVLIESSTLVYNQTGTGYCRSSDDCTPGGSGGGIANDGGAVTIHNSIIAQNSIADGGSGPDCTGIVSSQGPNFFGSADGCTVAGAGDDILNQHAFLGPLADNGGPTLTHALLPYSPALDAGSCTDISGGSVLTDQRGEPRPQGAGCDLGAFESEISTIPLPERLLLPLIGNKPN